MKKNKVSFLFWSGCLLGMLSFANTANAGTFTVTNDNDEGIGSLRWAIAEANINPGADTILFDSNYTIYPLSKLPPLTDVMGTVIDGGDNTVIINGQQGSDLGYGLKLASNYNVIKNLQVRDIFTSGNFLDNEGGIWITGNYNLVYGCSLYLNKYSGIALNGGAAQNKIQASFIGTSDGFTSGEGNGHNPSGSGGGIFLYGAGRHNIIGTDGDGINDEFEGNVISGNGNRAIYVYGTGTVIAGNLIGTDATGTAALLNSGNNCVIQDSSGADTVIGTNGDGVSDALEGNIISGNNISDYGGTVFLGRRARFSGNYVGVDITGTRVLANSGLNNIVGEVFFRYAGTLIGTDGDGVSDELERNIISGGSGAGINGSVYSFEITLGASRIAGNYIGTDVSGTVGIGNRTGISITNNIAGPADNLIIGTNGDGVSDAIEGNIISANKTGVSIYSEGDFGGVRVAGNLIGTDKTGTAALPNEIGVELYRTSDNIIGTNGDGVGDAVEGNIIVATGYAVDFQTDWAGRSSKYNTVAGNYLGTDVTGTKVLGSGGVHLHSHADHNTIGTNSDGISDELERNVIAGGANGFYTQNASNNRISGNYIGLGADGHTPLGFRGFGIMLTGGSGNIIGTDGDGMNDEGEGNIIVGRGASGNGIMIQISNNNRVAGNIIGTNSAGNLRSGFGSSGMHIYRGNDNQIGTDWDGVSDDLEANIITNNGHAPQAWWYKNGGVAILGQYNAIRGNSIYNNVGQGIDLIDGANQGITTPTLAAAVYVASGVAVSGTAVAGATVEIFTTDQFYGDGEGQTLVGKTVAAADGSFGTVVNGIFFDDVITATATDPAGNTSEFSKSTTTSGNQPPVLIPIGDQFVDEMENLIFTVAATDPENETLTITATNLPEGSVFDGAVFTWTPDYNQAGSYQVTFTTSDSVGGSDSETINITVNAVNAPPAAAPAGGGTYQVLTDITLGGQVSDFDGEILDYQWFSGGTQYCAGQINTIAGGGVVELPACLIAQGLPVGSHSVTLEVSDGFNLPVVASVIIEVIDTNAPTLAPRANLNILWPPNHNMEEISIVTNVWDDSGCYSLAASVSSNEPEDGLGDGDTGPDVTTPVIDVEADTITLYLRAERAGKGDGRIYSVEIVAIDCSGNSSTAIVEVSCPHDRKGN